MMKVQLVYQSKVNIFRCNNVHVYINVQSKKVSISRKNSLFHPKDQLLKHNKKPLSIKGVNKPLHLDHQSVVKYIC